MENIQEERMIARERSILLILRRPLNALDILFPRDSISGSSYFNSTQWNYKIESCSLTRSQSASHVCVVITVSSFFLRGDGRMNFMYVINESHNAERNIQWPLSAETVLTTTRCTQPTTKFYTHIPNFTWLVQNAGIFISCCKLHEF